MKNWFAASRDFCSLLPMLPLVSKMRPTESGASSLAKWAIFCSVLSSKTRKCSFSNPVTKRFSGSVTVTGIVAAAVEEVAKTAYRLEVIGASVLAVHLAEDGVRTALEREVEVGHDLPVGGKGAKEFGSDIAGLKTGEPEALEAGDLGAEGIDEGREGFRGVELAMSKCRIIAISA